MQLASLGKERIDEVFDPEKAIHRVVGYYLNHGYFEEWIEKDYEYSILTNKIYKACSGMKASEYKEYKRIS